MWLCGARFNIIICILHAWPGLSPKNPSSLLCPLTPSDCVDPEGSAFLGGAHCGRGKNRARVNKEKRNAARTLAPNRSQKICPPYAASNNCRWNNLAHVQSTHYAATEATTVGAASPRSSSGLARTAYNIFIHFIWIFYLFHLHCLVLNTLRSYLW